MFPYVSSVNYAEAILDQNTFIQCFQRLTHFRLFLLCLFLFVTLRLNVLLLLYQLLDLFEFDFQEGNDRPRCGCLLHFKQYLQHQEQTLNQYEIFDLFQVFQYLY